MTTLSATAENGAKIQTESTVCLADDVELVTLEELPAPRFRRGEFLSL